MSNKLPFEATPKQAKAIQDGIRTLLVAIDVGNMKMSEIGLKKDLLDTLPLKEGEKYFLQEEFIADEYAVWHKADNDFMGGNFQGYKPASQMTEAQSRFKFEVSVEVKRVFDLSSDTIGKIIKEGQDMLSKLDYYHRLSQFYNKKWASSVEGDKITAKYYDTLCKNHYQKVKDIVKEIKCEFKNWLKEQNIDYDSNPFVALIEIKEIV